MFCSHFSIRTDNVVTSYFQTQKKLTPKQGKWQDFLVVFGFSMEYKLEKANVVADALSRKAAVTRTKGDILEHIKEGLTQYSMATQLMMLAKECKIKRFWVDNDLLYALGARVFVPKWDNLRRTLIKECQDTRWAGHPGQRRTYAFLEVNHFWHQMKDDVEAYVRTCLICQQDKVDNKQPAGLLEPLPIPAGLWDSVSLGFISALPKSEGCGSIMVVMDRFLKYGTFIASTTYYITKEAAQLFFKYVVKNWGLPKTIISDRDPRFT